jgi:hypothetical protein
MKLREMTAKYEAEVHRPTDKAPGANDTLTKTGMMPDFFSGESQFFPALKEEQVEESTAGPARLASPPKPPADQGACCCAMLPATVHPVSRLPA